ncbi:MAG: hypothetical protein J5I90_12300 [Caldilineales bacterium]|nr:hypothetical protein [Caldilineales bacterium]
MRTIPLIQFGFGGVGRAVVRRVMKARDEFEWRYGIQLQYVALCDSNGAAVEAQGISFGDLERAMAAKEAGRGLADTPIGYQHEGLLDIVDVAGVTGAIVIDVTASDETVPALQWALDKDYFAVLANKKPLAGSIASFRQLTDSDRLRYEATVGAGMPIIAALRQALIASNDHVRRIEGCFSGTLGFLTTGLQAGESYSALVRHAKQQGYTEPDPRDDLGGMDVARKALILARTMGWPLELSQIEVESLYPPELAAGSPADFLEAISALDEPFRARVAEAQAAGQTLRYVAALESGAAQVGLRAVPVDSPVGRLQGTDNLAAFYTDVYAPNPMVLQGRGAGVDGTAAGVLADIVSLALTDR